MHSDLFILGCGKRIFLLDIFFGISTLIKLSTTLEYFKNLEQS
jgi:hypothetical protein